MTYQDYFKLIEATYKEQQYEQVSELAHTIKGASRSLSIESVATDAEKLELTLKNGQIASKINPDDLMLKLQASLSIAMAELSSFLKSMQ